MTAELALVLPMLVAVTIGLVWLLAVGAAQVRTVDAARETARAVARGDDQRRRGRPRAGGWPRPAAPSPWPAGGGEVRVTVSGEVTGPGGLFAHLPTPTVRAEAVAADEESPP